MDSFIDRMLSVMPRALTDQGRRMVFCMATRYEPNADPQSHEKLFLRELIFCTLARERVKWRKRLTEILGR